MRKYFNSLLFLSFTGAIISGILLYQHYYPEMELGFISCGKGFDNPCITVGQSPYASIFGLPLASFGIFYFTLITFLMLIADYAEDYYYHIFMGIILPLVVAGTAADVVLGILMIKIGELCKLCVSTYIINIIMLVLLVLYMKHISDRGRFIELLKGFFRPDTPDRKAVFSLFIVFIFFLAFSVFSGTNVLKIRSGYGKTSESQTAKLVKGFYGQEQEKIQFPASTMRLGNPDAKLKIHAFTDFLCSACYKFYQLEKYILAKYKNQVEIIYYHYPLDASCNKFMDDSVYPGSCNATRTMYAASASGFFSEYFFIHFSDYPAYKDGYTDEHIKKNLTLALKNTGQAESAAAKFTELMNSSSATAQIDSHINFAENIKIEATPTVYISGRKIVGVPPKEFLDAVITNELKKK